MPEPPFEPSQTDFPCNAVDKRRLAFLLSRIAKSKPQSLSDIKKSMKSSTAKIMGFTPADTQFVLEGCVNRGWLQTTKKGKTLTFALTECGKELLLSLRIYLPPDRSALLEIPMEEASLKENRRAAILFHLFNAQDTTQNRAQANKSIPGQDALSLQSSLAALIRQELFESGFIRWEPEGNQERYSLTAMGIDRLTTLAFWPTSQLKLSGEKLTRLLKAAREGKQSQTTLPSPPPAITDTLHLKAGQLREAIIECFEKLRREKYFRTGGVPIHEVRALIRQRFGDQAAGHDVLDPEIKKLRVEGKFHLVAITMNPTVTQQQLADSIRGINETLFFMEIVQ